MAKLRSYSRDAVSAIERAPAEVAIALVTAIEFSYAIESNGNAFQAWTELAVANLLALSIAWSATMLHALGQITERTRWTITLIGVLFAGWYGLFVIDTTHASEGWRALMVAIAFACIALAVPAWASSSGDPSLRLRRVNGRLLLRAFAIGLYGLAMFAGLALALKAIDTLFELNMDGDIYGHVFGWIMIALVPWVVAGGLNDYVRPLEQRTDVANIVHRLTGYLVPPLLALYYVILYAYTIRIGVTGELPKNLVSPMVLAAAILGVLALIVFDPRTDDSAGTRALRLAPPLFIPLGLLGLWAIAPRVAQYGWTEFRLLRIELLIVFLLLAALGTMQLLRKRPFSLRIIPAAVAIVLLVGAVGPWSPMAVSKRDQRQRLAVALRQANVNLDLPAAPRDTARRYIGAAVYDQIQGSATYLQQHFGEDAFAGILPPHAIDAAAWMQLPEYYGLARLGPSIEPRGTFADLPADQPVQLADGSIAYNIRLHDGADNSRATIRHDTLLFNRGTDTLHTELTPLLNQLRSRGPARAALPSGSYALPLLDQRGSTRGTLLVLSIGETVSENKPARIQHLNAVLILTAVTSGDR